MRLSGWHLLVASSVILAAVAKAETRPQYGGTLRVAMQIAPVSLDPADKSPDSISRRNVARLIFDTLVVMDNDGHIRPGLAVEWRAEPGHQRWQFALRRGVKFHDGSNLTGEVVAASLRAVNPAWTVTGNGDSLAIESKTPMPDLLTELALPRYAIAKRSSASSPAGTGPFRVSDWQAGRKLTLSANEDYWGGRPFLDSIAIESGKNPREQEVALELGRADVIELVPGQVHQQTTANQNIVSSDPVELVALVFAQDRQSSEDGRLREALSLSIDRLSLRNVLLQGQGELAGGVLPNWLSGYEFVFPNEFKLTQAQQLRADVQHAPAWTIGYDANDPLARVVAERVALNARDAGIRVQPATSSAADLKVVRAMLTSVDEWRALLDYASATGMSVPQPATTSVEDLYRAESTLLQGQRIIPILHLPVSYAVAPAVRGFEVDRSGTWELSDVWLGTGKL